MERQITQPRQPLIDLALQAQSEMFRETFREFAENYFANRSGKVEDVVAAYKNANLPQPKTDFRSCGGIVQKLVRDRKIRSIGTAKANDGSGRWMDVYRAA